MTSDPVASVLPATKYLPSSVRAMAIASSMISEIAAPFVPKLVSTVPSGFIRHKPISVVLLVCPTMIALPSGSISRSDIAYVAA
jgi:hypothetical protein